MSVPVPIAMPTSACASAGASLIPSPTMATTLSLALQPLDLGDLPVRQHLGHDAIDARLRARSRPPSARLSPVSITTSSPSPWQPRDRLARGGLDRIGDRDQAGERARPRRRTPASCPPARARSASAAQRRDVASRSPPSARRCRPRAPLPSTTPTAPRPVTRLELLGVGERDAPLSARGARSRRPADAPSSVSSDATSRSSSRCPSTRRRRREHDVGHRRASLGDGARLVEHDRRARRRPAAALRRP